LTPKKIELVRGWLTAAALLFSAVVSVSAEVPAGGRPHIILYLSDDHGVDYLGCYGNRMIRTPNMDRLAGQGMRFTRVFAGSPTCAPSRSILYTGLHSMRNGAMGNHTTCKPGTRSLPQYLGQLGYRVVLANKSHVGPPEVFPFEMLRATLPADPKQARKYRAEGLDTKRVDQFLAEHVQQQPNRPLCLILADNGPHVIWEKNKTYDPTQLPLPPIMIDTPKTRAGLANYYQDITTVDRRLGEVLESIRRHGFEPNTLFIYTSDQGPEWPRCKWTCYDGGLRVPFLVRWQGKVHAGAVSEALISFADVCPTFIEAAGGEPPAGLDGRSFLNVLAGQSDKGDEFVFAAHTRDGDMNVFPQRCVRGGRFKYILNLWPENKWTTHFTKVEGITDSHRDVYATWEEKARSDPDAARLLALIERHPAEELYDCQQDPYELHNLVGQPQQQERLRQLRQRLRDWLVGQNDREALDALTKAESRPLTQQPLER